MSKVLIEIENGAVISVETSSDDVEIYVFDHDLIREGSIGELKRYLANASEPVEVDGITPGDELIAKLEDLIAEGQTRLEDMTGGWGDDEGDDVGEVHDLTHVMRSRR